jgi:hypothetical protein
LANSTSSSATIAAALPWRLAESLKRGSAARDGQLVAVVALRTAQDGVGAVVRLGQTEAANLLQARHRWQEALLLLLRTE